MINASKWTVSTYVYTTDDTILVQFNAFRSARDRSVDFSFVSIIHPVDLY